MTNDDLWKCKYVTAGEDKDGITVPCCTLCGMPCEDVLRYGDEGCVLSMTKDEVIKIIEDACWWYHKKGCSGLTQVEIFEARDRAMQALNSLEEVYANGYNDGFTQAEVNYENDKALSQEPTVTSTDEPMTMVYPTITHGDTISRTEVMNVISDFVTLEKYIDKNNHITFEPLEQMINSLPSVMQKSETVTEFADRCRECGAKYGKMLKQKSGKWISGINWKCNNCGFVDSGAHGFNFCPNCGAKMESEEISEHNMKMWEGIFKAESEE